MDAAPPSEARNLVSKIAWALFAVTFLVRLLVVSRLTASPYFTPDAGDVKFYNDWALRILHGQWTDGRAFYGLPGYAFLMAGIYKLGGYNPFYLSLLQAVAEACTAYFIFKIAHTGFAEDGNPLIPIATGILAALGYAFFLPAQAFSAILMPTSWLVCLFWLTVYWAIKAKRQPPSLISTGAIGLAIGLMSMMVATIFFVIPLVLFGLWNGWEKAYWQRFAQLAFVFLAAILLGASPAVLHNRLVAHDAVFLSAHGGLNFYVGNNAVATGYPVIPDGLRAGQAEMLRDSISIAEASLRKSPSETVPRSAVSQYWSEKASRYIRENPRAWLRLEGQKIINFWNALQYDDLSLISELDEGGVLTPGLGFGLVASLGLAGMILAVRRHPASRWVAAAILLHMASLLTVFITERYRLAAVPGLLIFSAFLVVRLWQNLVSARWIPVASQVAVTVAATVFVTQPVPTANPLGLDSFNLGLHALALGEIARAEEKLRYAWRCSPEKDEINFALGNLYLTKKDPQRAKLFYQRTLRRNPRHDGALNNLGVIAMDQKMPAVAARFFEKSLEYEPTDAQTYFQLAQASRANGDIPRARAAVVQALILQPENQTFKKLGEDLEKASTEPAR